MSVHRFIAEAEAPERSLVVLNRTEPEQVQRMLEEAFDGQPIKVDEGSHDEEATDLVALVEDGEVITTSPLSALEETVLLVNSDLYKTGTKPLSQFELPAVLAGLDEVPFELRGYPESNKEKLLLIVISRYIERLAWESRAGRLRSSFQRLSRIRDERGTRRVYDQLAETDVDVHIYGQPDWIPPEELGVVAHAGYGGDFRDSWFVVHRPPDGDGGGRHAALIAVEVAPREWEGFWTFRPELVERIDDYIAHEL